MKKKFVITIVVLLCLFLGYRLYTLNKQYPAPEIQEVTMDEIVELEDYNVQLLSWDWEDSKILKEIVPDYSSIKNEDGSDYPEDKQKVAMVTLQITKTSDLDDPFDMTNVTLESGAWGNQWDAILYDEINGQGSLYLHMKKGETREITIPLILYDFEFKGLGWDSIEERKFYVVFRNYPKKSMIINRHSDL